MLSFLTLFALAMFGIVAWAIRWWEDPRLPWLSLALTGVTMLLMVGVGWVQYFTGGALP